jgi:RNA polymerase sigma-70 factor, ECF subfamily
MSTAVIGFDAEVRIPMSGSAQLHGPAPSAVSYGSNSAMMQNPGAAIGRGAYDESTCELELVSAARGGDQQAFMELCRRHDLSLKRRIRRIVRNREDAEDVLQDTLIRAFSKIAGFRAQCSFRTWIMMIATNSALMLLRKRRNHPETGFGLITADGKEFEILQVSDPLPNPEQTYAERQAIHRVSQAVKMLPIHFRILVEGYHRNDVKLVDVANAIGITEAAAKSRLMRARNMLRRSLNHSSDVRRTMG